MSVLLAAVSNVVATPVATPIVQVVHDTVVTTKLVPTVAPELLKGAQLALLFVTGVGGSIFHQVLEAVFSKSPSGWKASVNVAIEFLFGIAVALLSLYVQGNLVASWDSAIDAATVLLVVLGSSQGRYAFKKWVDSLGADKVDASPVDGSVAEPVVPQKAGV